MRGFVAIASLAALLAATLSANGSNWKAAGRNYVNSTCHEKIDPKNLKGDAKKAAWKACKESPDSYN